jgi:FADH2 O2-dependent halogenase
VNQTVRVVKRDKELGVLRVDVTIIGSGFSGSILAWILSSQGLSVVLVDRSKHPRFAIGESSTPIADSILRRLGENYGITPLEQLSCWGSWQQHYPELPCGRKRGFSYLVHQKNTLFQEESVGGQSLLVAASPTDFRSDTHWHRASVDNFLWENAVRSGAKDLTGYEVVGINVSTGAGYVVECVKAMPNVLVEDQTTIQSEWVVDASGSSSVLSKFLEVKDWTEHLKTQTHSLFAHFSGVKNWCDVVSPSQRESFKNPFSADDAAQHHLLGEGWMWMLRFNHGVTSVGYTTPLKNPLVRFESLFASYPSIAAMMSAAKRVGPPQAAVTTSRLQRWVAPVPHGRCVMLPTASLTLDPLHSTGIAHALAGVERISKVILSGCDTDKQLKVYEEVLVKETRLLDQLVAMAYRNLGCFERFTAACMVYFAAAIRCEEAYQAGEKLTHLWNASDESFLDFVNWFDSVLDSADSRMFSEIRRRLEPWNNAGLMDPLVHNRYAYTATK